MNERRLSWAWVLVLVAACGDDPQDARNAADGDVSVLFPDGGGFPDTTIATDTTATVDDSAVATETTVEDTVVATETIEDTTVEDTFVATETTIEDTFVATETVEDTFVATETIEDTVVATETAIEDTFVAPDITKEDTAEPDVDTGYSDEICTTDVTTAGANCGNAYVIGRPNANTGFGHQGTTIGAGNDSDFSHAVCGDSFNDRFYMIYLEVGEQLTVNANPDPATFDVTFGLYRGPDCETAITCVDNDVSQTTPDTMLYQAVEPGWHAIVLDGRNTNGNYTVVVTLDCHQDDCGCN